MPLVVRWPDGAGAGETRDGMVSLIDLAPTFASLASVQWPTYLPGHDLHALAQDEATDWRDRIFAQYHPKQLWFNPIRTVRTDRWKLNECVDGRDEFYDLQEDPGELRNEVHAAQHADVIGGLRASLHHWRENTLDPLL